MVSLKSLKDRASFECARLTVTHRISFDEDSEFSTIKDIVLHLKKFDAMCTWLQKDEASTVKMFRVRFYFDKLVTEYPALGRYLGKDSELVHSPDFDNAISKIQLAADLGKTTPSQLLLLFKFMYCQIAQYITILLIYHNISIFRYQNNINILLFKIGTITYYPSTPA